MLRDRSSGRTQTVRAVPYTIEDKSLWVRKRTVADRFGDGRVLIAGDAAHAHPPNGGLVRPDGHVAWRGDSQPDDALLLIDTVRGASVASLQCVTKWHILHTRKVEAQMTASRAARAIRAKRGRATSRGMKVSAGPAAALEEARRAGLLDGDRTQHVSFRAPPALVAAAKRESGVVSPTELGILALATLAQPDPAAAFLKRTHGRLGETHTLEY